MTRQVLQSLICFALLTVSGLHAGEVVLDKLAARARDGGIKTFEGRITADEVRGVKINVNGAEMRVARKDVVKFYYGRAHMRSFIPAMKAFESEDYTGAISLFDRCRELSERKLPKNQQALFLQHLIYHKALSYYRLNKFAEAQKEFSLLLASNQKTAYIFEASYYEAHATEMTRPLTALAKYKRYVSSLPKPTAETVRYVVLCKLGVLRMELKSLLKTGGNETEVKKKLAQLLEIKKDESTYKLLSLRDKGELISLETQIMSYLKEFKKLSQLLNAAVRNAQKGNARDVLKNLYLQRANSNWQLMTGGEGDKAALAEQIRFDYLRASIGGYSLSKEEVTTANYRLAKCFEEIQDQDWLKRAIYHLQKAKSVNKGPAALKVPAELDALKEKAKEAAAPEPAAKKSSKKKAAKGDK